MTDMPDSRRRILELPQKRLALLALQLQDELARERDRRHEPIAVVGMGCRFPGGIDSPDAYWKMLQEGRDLIVEVSEDRWPIDELYDPDPDAPGRIATRWGGYLEDVQRFDAAFFSISPREARAMDPQQRLIMEVTWRAFEDAGIPPSVFRDRRAGVFVGLCNNDYLTRLMKEGPNAIDAYLSSGNAYSVASGRVSFTFGFQGPAVTCDTACSSSLVALHDACRSLREGESEMVVAAGVNVMCSPETAMALSRARMMAPDGRCKTFDDAADGFVRAEGCGVLVLKRLSDARRDGDRIHALLKGSALGQDGRSTGLTVPNGPAQEEVVRQALADARLEPDDIDYVEAHGTGTSLGDPIEIRALGRVFGNTRERPLYVGSVKTNMGHLESAAGIAGVIKAVLSVREGHIPPHLHLKTPSRQIEWDDHAVEVAPDGLPWPDTGRPRRAGVSSFGFSGTNAHVIVEEAPKPSSDLVAATSSLPLQLLPFSGFTPEALDEVSDDYLKALDGADADAFRDFAHTARVGRTGFGWRRAVVAADTAQVASAFARDEDAPALIEGLRKVSAAPEVAFVFTGQGAQHPGMGRALYEHLPAFRDALDQCAASLEGTLPMPLLDALFEGEGETAPIYRTEIAQPAVVAFEWSLAQLWKSWGVRPAAVLGHSLGEFAAACVAGVMSLDDTLGLVAERGRLLDSLPGGDRMASVFASAEVVEALIREVGGEVMIGALNSPDSTVISGRAEPVSAVMAACAQQQIECRELRLDKGFHSSRVDPILDALEARAREVEYHPPSIPIAWNVTGELSASAPSARYWRDHARQPVRFLQGVRAVAGLEVRHFLEVGPHPALSPMVAQTLEALDPVLIPSLRRGGDASRDILEAAAHLWVEGVDVDLGALGEGQRVAIPGHPLRGDRYWVETPSGGAVAATSTPGLVPGVRLSSAVPIWEALLTPQAPAFLTEHRFRGEAVVPGPLHVEMALEAARREGWAMDVVVDLELVAPARVGDSGLRVQTVVEEPAGRAGDTDGGAGGLRFRILSRPVDAPDEDRWTENARGVLTRASDPVELQPDLQGAEPVETVTHLQRLAELGFQLGPSAALWSDLVVGTRVATARLTPPGSESPGPVGRALLLDAAAQVLGAALAGGGSTEPKMLAGIDEVAWAGAAGDAVQCVAVVHEDGAGEGDSGGGREPHGRARHGRVSGDAVLMDAQGRTVAWLRGARLGPVPAAMPAEGSAGASWHHQLQWRATALPESSASPLPDAVAEMAAGAVDAAWSELARDADLPAYVDALPALRDRAATHVAIALTRLGLDGSVGASIPADPSGLPVVAAHRRLFPRLLHILDEAGYLSALNEGGYRVARPFPQVAPEASADGGLPEELLDRCGAQLAEVLTGDVDPLELLFPAGGRDTTRSIYRDTAFGRAFNGAVREAVRAVVSTDGASTEPGSTDPSASTAGAPIRVLEVGAGSGSTTRAALEALQGRPFRYLFTDVGAGLVAEATEELGDRREMSFRTLDLELDPESQGISAGSHDLVIAANVVHATARLDRSLSNLHELLAPGGLLILLEGTRPEAWVDVTFGLTDGWWRFTDSDLRGDYPLVATPEWRSALERAGFDAVHSAPAEHAVAQTGQVLLLARKRRAPAVVGLGGEDELSAALREAGGVETVDAEQLFDGRTRSAAELLTAMRTLVQDEGRGRLRVVTAAGQSVGGDSPAPVDPHQATLWGIARTFALEHPDRWAGVVDVDAATPAHEVAERILAEVRGGGAEDQVAWRGAERFVPRLAPAAQPAEATDTVTPGSYLITGGLGGLGLGVATWLAERGASRLVLVSRSATREGIGGDDPRGAALDALEALGVQVDVRPLDVTDGAAVDLLLDGLRKEGEPVRGIVHAAAVFDSTPLVEMTPEQLNAVLAPKAIGAENLLAATRQDELDFMVLFSSTTSLLGVAELGAYAAANQYLDALALREHQAGRPVVSISWGIWDEMRLASDEEQDRYRRVGLRPMASPAALEAMGRVLRSGVAHAVVADVDWERLRGVYESRRARPILAELGEADGTSAPSRTALSADPASSGSAAEETPGADDFSRLAPAERLEAVMASVEAEVRAVLRLPTNRAVDRELGFFEMGMDSLMSVELRSRLSRRLGMRLPSTLAFNHPTISEAGRFIDSRMEAASSAETTSPGTGAQAGSHVATDAAPTTAPTTEPTPDSKAASDLAASDLSREELERRLSDRLAALEKPGGDR